MNSCKYYNRAGTLWVACVITVAPVAAAEFLPVCEKCLNPRVLSKSGIGTSAAAAEAKVVAEDAAVWCAGNRPRDKYCVEQEVKNGGDGGRTSFHGSADCSGGLLHSISGGDYLYAGVWPDGPGRGRPMLKDPDGNIPRWNSIAFGTGVARSEWHRWGGYSLAGQWQVLCGSAVPAANVSSRSVTVGKPQPASVPAKGAAAREWLASCFRCPTPTVVSKAGISTANAVAEGRMTAEELRNTCSETDPQNTDACVRRELAEAGKKAYRATADCTTGRITTIDEQQYTLAGLWDNSDLGGGRTKWRGTNGKIVGRDNMSNGLAISQQWELLCPGQVTASLLAQPVKSSGVNGTPVGTAPSQPASVCSGKRYCAEVTSFAAIIRDFRQSALPDSTRMVSATVRFLNKTNRPLTLGYVRNAGVAIDEQGNRYILPSPDSVRGIGEIAGRDFDPKFTLQPGQTSDARFEFVWRWNRRDIIGQRSWDIELALREVGEAAPGQYRFGQEHALQFKAVPPAAAASPELSSTPLPSNNVGAVNPLPPAVASTPSVDACAGKRGCFDAGSFVAEIKQATLTHEGNFQDRVARLNVQIHNTGSQPVSLAYVAKSSVLIDNLANRFFWGTAGTYDNSATGIGKVEGNKADPQFTLAPGESRTATFTLRRSRPPRTDPDGSGSTFTISLAQLEVLYNGQQVRTTREHSLTFSDFGVNLPGATDAPGKPQQQQSFKDLGVAIRRGLEKKK